MLRFLYGRTGSRLNRAALERIAASAGTDAPEHLVLVPRHFSHECERLLAETLGDRAPLLAEVLSLERLANRVFSLYGGLADRYLDASGQLLVMSVAAARIAPELRTMGGLVRRTDFLQGVISLSDELKRSRITPETLAETAEEADPELGRKLRDLALLCSAYQSELGRLKDPRDLDDRLRDVLDESGYAAGRRVTMLGFTEFTAQEYAILEVLLRDCAELTLALEGPVRPGDDEELFYGQRETAERLKRLCERLSIGWTEETLPICEPRPDGLRWLEQELFREGAPLPFPGDAAPLFPARENSVRSECERTADEILTLCREHGYQFREMAVAVPSEGDYRGALTAAFEARGIAYFLDSTDDVTHKPIISALISAIDMLQNDFSPADVRRFLDTGLSPIDFDAGCELKNYMARWQLRGSAWRSCRDWTMNPFGFSAAADEASEEALRRINRSREAVSRPFLAFLRQVGRSGEHSARTLTAAFYRLFCDLGLEQRIEEKRESLTRAGELQTAGEYAQLWGLVCDQLDLFNEILADTPIDLASFTALFRLVLSGVSVGSIPAALDSVPVGEAGRLRHRSPKVLFLLGASAGAFPEAVKASGLLSDRNREALCDLGLPLEPSARRLAYRALDVAYAALTLPSERLYVSWCSGQDGSLRAPSFYITRLMEVFHLTVAEPMGDERYLSAPAPALELALSALSGGGSPAARAALRYFEARPAYAEALRRAEAAVQTGRDNLSPAGARRLYGRSPGLTPSRIDRFRTCRFGYFCSYGLGAKPLRAASLDAPESGTLLHYVLEHTVREIGDGEGFDQITDEAAQLIASRWLDRYAEEVLGGLADKSARVRFLFRRLGDTVRRLVADITAEMRVSAFRPFDFELSFGRNGDLPAVEIPLEEGGKAYLSGTVDRVDGWVRGDKLYLRVIDYKSGIKKFDLSDVWHGLSLQMLIYLFALGREGYERYRRQVVGAGILYLPVRDVTVSARRGESAERIAAEEQKQLSRSGLLLAEPEVVAAMDGTRSRRYVPVGFNRDGSFDARSSVATLERFGQLERHVQMQLQSMARELMRGEIGAEPAVFHGRQACETCDYADICAYDESNGRDHARYLGHVSDVWDRFAEETAAGGQIPGEEETDALHR